MGFNRPLSEMVARCQAYGFQLVPKPCKESCHDLQLQPQLYYNLIFPRQGYTPIRLPQTGQFLHPNTLLGNRNGHDTCNMPTTLPVPSKGALRALRSLALGTSCTVAVGAGLLTEDRRRRIHTAQQVYENAQTLKSLKSTRRYSHTDVAEQIIEEKVLWRNADAFWLPSNVSRSKSFAAIEYTIEEDEFVDMEQMERSVRKVSKMDPPTAPIRRTLSRLPLSKSVRPEALAVPKTLKIASSSSDLTQPSVAKVRKTRPRELTQEQIDLEFGITQGQINLALELEELLRVDPLSYKAAIANFLNVYEDGKLVTKAGMAPILVDTAFKLFSSCVTPDEFAIQEKILVALSRHGPFDEDQFELFKPTRVMLRMMKRVMTGPQQMNENLLQDIALIYLTKLTSKPTTASDDLQRLGERLCEAACKPGLYELTVKLCARLSERQGDRPPRCVAQLIEAVHAGKNFKRSFHFFKSLYTQTKPDQVQFYRIGNLVLGQLLENNRSSHYEEFLTLATRIAEKNGLKTSSTWMLRILGAEWRTNLDIAKTRVLFDWMLPQLSTTSHPQAVFAAIMQFCIEARQESAALDYYAQLCTLYPESAKDIRVLGHIAQSKAQHGDWNEVKTSLQMIHDLNTTRDNHQQKEFSGLFTPILKTFTASHSVGQVEEFVQLAINEWDLKITPFISNLMVGVYMKEREVDPMIRWIELAASMGCDMDAATFNVIIGRLVRNWNFSFLEVFRLYQRVTIMDKELKTRSTDCRTIQILEDIAISRSRDDETARKHLARLKNVPISEVDGSNFASGAVKINRRMLRAYHDGKFEKVLQLYNNAQSSSAKLGPQSLLVAVKATLKVNGHSVKEATALIKKAQDEGQDISWSVAKLMVHRMQKLDLPEIDVQGLADMTGKEIQTLESHGIKVPPNVLTHTLSLLVQRGIYRSAIGMWQSMSSQFNRVPDLVTLTVLLEAYVGIQFGDGIKWVMQTLTTNNITPDPKFYAVMRVAKRRLGDQTTATYRTFIEETCEHVNKMRQAQKAQKAEAVWKIFKMLEENGNRRVESGGLGGNGKAVATALHPKEMEIKPEFENAWEDVESTPRYARAASSV